MSLFSLRGRLDPQSVKSTHLFLAKQKFSAENGIPGFSVFIYQPKKMLALCFPEIPFSCQVPKHHRRTVSSSALTVPMGCSILTMPIHSCPTIPTLEVLSGILHPPCALQFSHLSRSNIRVKTLDVGSERSRQGAQKSPLGQMIYSTIF